MTLLDFIPPFGWFVGVLMALTGIVALVNLLSNNNPSPAWMFIGCPLAVIIQITARYLP